MILSMQNIPPNLYITIRFMLFVVTEVTMIKKSRYNNFYATDTITGKIWKGIHKTTFTNTAAACIEVSNQNKAEFARQILT